MNIDDRNIDPAEEPGILENKDLSLGDPTVVVTEADRTVLLTEDETIIFEKPIHVETIPSNRPRRVYGGMWGPVELGVFGASLLVLLGVAAFYLFWVVPAGRELDAMRAERDRLEQELISARSKYGSITSTETQVAKLVSSVSDFESAYLPVAATGRTALYQRLNGLIAAYGLLNTNGPNYSPLDLNEQQSGTQPESQKSGRAKYKSIFPGVYVTMTVEGSYQNLRRFIREIETAGEFVIISSVELEPTETKKIETDITQPPAGQQAAVSQGFPQNFPTGPGGANFRNQGFSQPQQVQNQRPARAEGKTLGETVSLRLEMAAYFRRDVAAAPPVAEGGQ